MGEPEVTTAIMLKGSPCLLHGLRCASAAGFALPAAVTGEPVLTFRPRVCFATSGQICGGNKTCSRLSSSAMAEPEQAC